MNKQLKEFYKDKTVYITGITGFKGTWLALILKELGAKVLGIGLPPKEDSLFNAVNLSSQVEVIIGDITAYSNESLYLNSIVSSNPDVFFHLASQSLIHKSYEDPYTTFHTNIMGTVITHEILRGLQHKVSFVNVTNNKQYKELSLNGDLKGISFNLDPYSLSKECSDLITQSYNESFNTNILSSTIRTGNVIGGGEFRENKLISSYFTALTNKEPLYLYHPLSRRYYSHIIDVNLYCIIVAMLQYKNHITPSTFDVLSTDKGCFTIELIEELNLLNNNSVNIKASFSFDQIQRPKEIVKQKDNEISIWQPFYKDVKSMIKSTSSWYNDFYEGNSALEITKNQIKEVLLSYE